MNKEIWKDILDYEGLYQVSNLGNIKSFYNNKERVLKPRKVKDGYLMVALYKNKKQKNIQVHRLVAKYFIKDYDENLEVNHKDYNKENNKVNNLEMVTRLQNVYDYFKKNSKTGIIGINIQNGKYRVRYKKKEIGRFDTLEEAVQVRKEAEIKYWAVNGGDVL